MRNSFTTHNLLQYSGRLSTAEGCEAKDGTSMSGSSFQSIWARKLVGLRDQGVILLVLLSDSMCGGGGTAFVRGLAQVDSRKDCISQSI